MSLLLLLQREYEDSLFAASVEETLGLGVSRQDWSFALANSNGTLRDVMDPAILSAELVFRRSEATTLELQLQGEDDRAYNVIDALVNTRPLVYAYCNGELEFAGFISAVKASAEEDVAMTVSCMDALGMLQYRITDSEVELYDQTAGAIIAGSPSGGFSLLYQANAPGATGLVAGSVDAGVGVETFNTSRDVVYDKVRELATLANGPDLRVRPLAGDATFGYLDVGPLYTSTKVMAYFAYGPDTLGNLLSFDWEITPPLTRVTCVGNETEGDSKVDASVTTAEARLGVWQGAINNNDLYLDTDCSNAANAEVRLDWKVAASFTPDPAITPRPLRDYNVGDLVNVRAKRGSILYKGDLRIREIGISIDDSGVETAHRVEAEAGGPGLGQQIDETNIVFITQDTAVATNNLASSFS